MTEIYRRYQHGEVIPSKEFNTTDGLEVFGGIAWQDHVQDKNRAQFGLDGEVYWQKAKPIQKRLERATDIQESQERVDTFQKCQEWQIPLITRRVKIIKK